MPANETSVQAEERPALPTGVLDLSSLGTVNRESLISDLVVSNPIRQRSGCHGRCGDCHGGNHGPAR